MFAASKTASLSGYQIQRSLRFNSADSAYLNRTPASAGNQQIYTISAWVKRSALGSFQHVLSNLNSGANNGFTLLFTDADKLQAYDYTSAYAWQLETTQVFRDVSAWYHIVLAVDTTQATASNRVKLYVNGSQVTVFGTATYPTQNYSSYWNNTSLAAIGRAGAYTVSGYLNGYLTEIYNIDGQALTPSSFGQTNANTGVWEPKPYAGTYGTNGFYLNFSDNSNTTATTLGKDYSGNGNNWTPNNFSVSAGAGNDSLVDVPTAWGTDTGVGGTVRGNYCTLNPVLQNAYWASPNRATLTNGNLDAGGSAVAAFSTFEVPANEKIYIEATCVNVGTFAAVQIAAASRNTFELNYLSTGQKQLTGGTNSAYGASWGTGDIIGVAIDRANNTATFYKNGVSQGAITHTFPSETVLVGAYMEASPVAFSFNFGQRPFAYTAPSGFKALCTQNLPTPTIGATAATQAGKFFNPVLYTGNGSNSRSVTGVGFQPDFVWMKARSQAYVNGLANVVCGVNKYLVSNTTNAELTNDGAGYLSSFDSDGFALTGGVSNNNTFNQSSQTYVAWNWKANGAGVTNTSGSITSTVSANTTSGFSVVTYTGTGANATIGHGLGAVPKMIIVKGRTGSLFWTVYHASAKASGVGPETTYMILNTTDAAIGNSTPWNSTSPTSSVFSVGTASVTNTSGTSFVAYCFAEVPGFSKFGSYTGNGSTDGPFVYCGFRPKYIMIKNASATQGWCVVDAVRNTYNLVDNYLQPNNSNAEGSGFAKMDILSNGFKIRDTDSFVNGSGNTLIFAAFAEAPQKFALAR